MFYEPMVLGSKIENTANFATPVGTWYNIFNKFKGRKRILRQKRLVTVGSPTVVCFVSFGAFSPSIYFRGMELS
jgi:hypothetical protein